MLERALRKLVPLNTGELFTYSVVVVDNDSLASARDVAVRVGKEKETGLRIAYDVEPERNISLALNRSVRNADGPLIAFIDDDEFPSEDWLLNHFRVLTSSNADGVLAP